MKKEQYRAVIRSQKEAAKPAKKLIHLIINFRSWRHERYPKDFVQIARQIKKGSKLFDCDGLWYFFQLEGNNWRQPNFDTRNSIRGNFIRETETESDLPF